MPSTYAYLDAGSGAAIAAVIASGAVGLRAVVGNATSKLRRSRSPQPEPALDGIDAAEGASGESSASPAPR
jgi:hypothetical protein